MKKERRRKGQATRSKTEAFERLIRVALAESGCVINPAWDHEWAVETKFGKLTIAIHRDSPYMAVFTRFDRPELARGHVDINPYSGKWNHHYPNEWTAEACVEEFVRRLARVMPPSEADKADPVEVVVG